MKNTVYFIKHLKGIAFIDFIASVMDVPQFVSTFQLMKDVMHTIEIKKEKKINLKETPFFPQKKCIPVSFKIFCNNTGVSFWLVFFQILSKYLLSLFSF